MKKYLVNRILRSIFSIIMVMLLSVVLIFSFIPQSEIYNKDNDYKTYMQVGQIDKAELAKLAALERHGYIEYVSLDDYCESLFPDTVSTRYQACVARYDDNEDKQNFIKKYTDLGWEKIELQQSKYNNCDAVTREDVENGDYEIKDNQKFIQSTPGVDSPTDELYEVSIDKNGEEVFEQVTFNHRTYFKKDLNPLVTFWNWITGIINFDTKNSVENYRSWSYEKQRYLYENKVYSLVFEYETPNGNKNEEYVYDYNENDMELQVGEISIIDSTTNKPVVYSAVGGISTGYTTLDKTIKDYEVVKKFTDENDISKGGYLEINVNFTDNTSVNLRKDVAKYLVGNIPVYVSDNETIWYIGNSSTNIKYDFETTDFELDPPQKVNYIKNLVDLKTYEKEVERGYSVKLDEYGTPALTCEGCEYKYSIYFDNKFPYIHFNFIRLSLGESIVSASAGKDITNIMTDNQGDAIFTPMTDLSGEEHNGSYEFHTCTYNPNELDSTQKKVFNDNYTNCNQVKTAPSRIATSFIIGILATIIAYFVGVPIGVVMARNKEKWIDKLGMAYIIVMFAVPSLAYIYFVKSMGQSLFNLPGIFQYGNVLTYILPIISLSLGSIASMMMWTRRYIIDQENSDYVKFARAKGLSESQIFFKHILRNAIVPITHGIPGSIIGAVAGAMVTEKVYNVTGTGHLMVESIQGYNNWAAIGLIFFFTVLGIISLILGDIVITLVDPRISFADTGGRK